MSNFIYRDATKLFKINKDLLPLESRRTDVLNGLYAAIFTEFAGAYKNKKYKHLTNKEKLNEINIFAENWLRERHLI